MKMLSGKRAAGAIGAGVAALVLVALYLAGLIGPAPQRAGNPSDSAAVQTGDIAAPQPAADAVPRQVETTDQPGAAPSAPQIDIFRLQPDGEASIAGQGTPGWTVQILLDGAVQTIAEPGSDGRFAVFLSLPPAVDPRLLTLRMVDAEIGTQIDGTQQVVVAPPALAQGVEPAVADLPAQATSADTGPAVPPAQPPSQDTAVLPDDSTGASKTPVPGDQEAPPPIVMMADADGARVLQSPGAAAPQALSGVALDTISYSDDGDVQLGGRAVGQGIVRIYLDNRPIATSRIAADGTWRTALPKVDTGIYTLRIDEVTTGGTVASRVETPFKREDRRLLAGLQDPGATGQDMSATEFQPAATPAIRVMTVQPGNTLWAISRETYGEGMLYVRVFEANSERIRDPDLIYPGQVFTLPDQSVSP